MLNKKIVITGAAGLVGQNLILLLKELGYTNIVAIDKHSTNTEILRSLHPEIKIILNDLAEEGSWCAELTESDCLVMLHAQITGLTEEPFTRNNLDATKLVLKHATESKIPYIVHISSSVVISVADDWYTRTKREQEKIVEESGIPHCVLRPTLMFGWFDPKHLGWLNRYMNRSMLFPVPGTGKFLRQPLYARDFCRVIERCIATKPQGLAYDVVGQEEIYYIDIIKKIKQLTNAKAAIVKIPFKLFEVLLQIYGLFVKKPPFTAQQLRALVAGDYFKGVDIKKEFLVTPTPLEQALRETYCDPRFNQIVLESTT